MKACSIGLATLATMGLASCAKNAEVPAGDGLFGGHGRHLGVAIYAPGRMWAEIVRTPAATSTAAAPNAATPRDDEQIIVVVDSKTGELRQCGNLSGVCIAMNPLVQAARRHDPCGGPETRGRDQGRGTGGVEGCCGGGQVSFATACAG